MRQQAIGGWHVLYVKSRQEKKAYLTLSELGIQSFLPLVKQERQWSDRKKIIEVPLFPSYLFVKIDDRFDFEKVITIQESCFYLKIGSEYAKVSEKEIDNIKLFLNLKEISCIRRGDFYNFKAGQRCLIKIGPMKGLYCEIYKCHKGDRNVRVVIDSINQSIIAKVPDFYLEPEKLVV